MIIGTLCTSLGLATSMFVENVYHLFGTLGVLCGKLLAFYSVEGISSIAFMGIQCTVVHFITKQKQRLV
jgi:hypothetical protein